MVRSREPFKF